jgi:hypothetical protein
MSRGPGHLQRRVRTLVTQSLEPLRLIEIRGMLWGWRPHRRGIIVTGQPGRWAPIQGDDRALRRALRRLVETGAIRSIGTRTRRRYLGAEVAEPTRNSPNRT